MWMKEEYREQVMKLEGQTRECSISPEWDIENDSSLPADDSE